ncbi:FAD-dependent oxidoreductase [Aquisalimonas sp.]|uniref:NAD(P)/FAD-dependent oxidoreductase n=1 Tax=unclassified Aquisalimonas TaxID=2644645 RepID=UPI0025C61B64|nr:FAD-dependent oxidoreductase [Aquisalimonas sp.]
MRHVIVGAGPAGVVAAEQLRGHDPEAEITLISGEPEPPYSRMAIPYYLIENIDEAGTYLRKQSGYFDEQRIRVLHDQVTGVDSGSHSVALAQGGSLGFDRLLVATGSRPLDLPVPGGDRPEVHHCWTLEDARAIVRGAQPGAKVVLIGAGFIGCIILESLALRRTELTVVEAGNRMVPRMMDETAGGLIRDWCESRGVRVHVDAKVASIDDGRGNHAAAVRLENGQVLDADVVIAAVGVTPNAEFLQGAGLDMDAGILVDRQLKSSVDGIYAAGDVAQGVDFSTGGQSVHAIQPTAADHARVAASNMVGRHQAYHGSVNMNVLDTLGLISSSFGLWMGKDGGDSITVHDPDRYRYLNLQFEDDRMVGASALGLTEHVGVLRGLIQTRVRLGVWKERLRKDPSRLMEAYLGATRPIGYNAHVL